MTSRLLVALLLCAADALHYLEGSAGSTEEIFASGTYSYAPQQYILYGIEYDHSAGARLRRPVHPGEEGGSWRLVRLVVVVVLVVLLLLVVVFLLLVVVVYD